jgi:hypothetical protein
LVEGLARVLVYSYFLGLALMILAIPYFLVAYLAAVNIILPNWVGDFFIIVYGIGVTWLPFAGIQGVIPWFYISGAFTSPPAWAFLAAAALMVPVAVVQYLFATRLYRAAKKDETGMLTLAGYHHVVLAFVSAVYFYFALGPLVSIIAIFLNLIGFYGFRNAVNEIREYREINRPRSTGAPIPGGKAPPSSAPTANRP